MGQAVALLRRQDRDRLDAIALDAPDGETTVLAVCSGTPVALARIDGAELRPVRVLNL